MDNNSIKQVSNSSIEIKLQEGDILMLLEPESLIMYEGNPENIKKEYIDFCKYEDRKILFTKNTLTKTIIEGTSNLLISLPREFFISVLPIKEATPLFYNFKNVIFYTNGVSFSTKSIKIKEFTKSIVMGTLFFTRFTGNGYVGMVNNAELFKKNISKISSVLINKNSIFAIPESAIVKLIPVGNELHAHTTNPMCAVRGTKEYGEYIVYQGANVGFTSQQLKPENIVKRFIKEFVPGASTIWK